VKAVDAQLVREVARFRLKSNIIIDSHAVTREEFGYRITASDRSWLRGIKLDAIFVLRCHPGQLAKRILAEPAGRRSVSPAQAETHQILQECVAVAYGVILPCPVYVIDSSVKPATLVANARRILDRMDAAYFWK
jgi:adenylate kinase